MPIRMEETSDTRKDDKTDKAFKMRPAIDHLNSKFSVALLKDSDQSIDEHGEIQRQIWNKVVHKIKTNKIRFQILVLQFK